VAGNMNNLHSFRISADGTAGPFDFVCTRGWEVIDQVATWNATVGGTTLRLNRSTAAAPAVFNAVGPTLTTDTVDDIEYVATLVAAQKVFATGDTMRMVAVGLPQADVIVEVLPTTWIAG